MTIVCNRCSEQVRFDNVSEGYYAWCVEHDEDLYKFETREVA